MKLIEMLVEAGLNGWKWPDGTIAITQDKDKSINQYATADGLETNEHGTWKYSSSWQTYLRLSHEDLCLASDWDAAIITREQYEAALAAKNDGWIEWGGGECPVEKGTLVDVRYRDGEELCALPADCFAPSSRDASFAFWRDSAQNNDIIAYRLHQPNKADLVRAAAWNVYAGITKADDEVDLNECIVQDAAPVWNGEDLPPVGCFCEITDHDGMLVYGHGESGEVIAHVENTAVIRMSYGLGCFEAGFLRPLRTEAERKRDEAIEQMIKIATIHTTKSLGLDLAFNSIYNAIAAGEITGVKLEGL